MSTRRITKKTLRPGNLHMPLVELRLQVSFFFFFFVGIGDTQKEVKKEWESTVVKLQGDRLFNGKNSFYLLGRQEKTTINNKDHYHYPTGWSLGRTREVLIVQKFRQLVSVSLIKRETSRQTKVIVIKQVGSLLDFHRNSCHKPFS